MSLWEMVRSFRRQHLRALTLFAVAVAVILGALVLRSDGRVVPAVTVYLAGFALVTFALRVEMGVLHAVQDHNSRHCDGRPPR
jgi:hypothetical protein